MKKYKVESFYLELTDAQARKVRQAYQPKRAEWFEAGGMIGFQPISKLGTVKVNIIEPPFADMIEAFIQKHIAK